jgi:hypothetical protein
MMRSHSTRFGLILALFVSLLGGVRVVHAEDTIVRTCGFRALFILLNIEGRPPTIAALATHLKSTNPRGSSMKELRDTARACGLGLNGVRLKNGNRQPDRPILAFVKRGSHGHYLVVRPVGHTGSRVQVIDSNREPVVMDAAVLYASPEWTGLALISERPNLPARMVGGMVLLLALALVAGIGKRGRWKEWAGEVGNQVRSVSQRTTARVPKPWTGSPERSS